MKGLAIFNGIRNSSNKADYIFYNLHSMKSAHHKPDTSGGDAKSAQDDTDDAKAVTLL